MTGVWAGFITAVLLLLALDLGVFHRQAKVVSVREAIGWSAGWIALALAFAVFVYFAYDRHWSGLGTVPDPVDGLVNTGARAVEKYLTGYVVEKSLSVDNIFVIAIIFGSFGVPPRYQHRVLFWGILGALVLRGAMIGVGARVVAEYHWVLYLFAAFLIGTAIRLLIQRTEPTDLERHVVVRWTRRVFPVTARLHGQRFIVRAGAPASYLAEFPGAPPVPDPVVDRARPGTLLLTPLALALVMVETTDLIFAVDSIPAVLAITRDPFIVFSSNIFAILGLRALYFSLAGVMGLFHYLHFGLALILVFVGLKMIASKWIHIPTPLALGVVVGVIATCVIASLVNPKKVELPHPPGADELEREG